MRSKPARRWRAQCVLAALAALLALPVAAQVARLDDSASPRAEVQADFGHATPVDGHTVRVPFGRVEYRLATMPYIGKRARIYYVVPPQIPGLTTPGGLTVQWRASGRFAPGQAQPGMRAPVWTGVVQGPWLQESLDLDLLIDLRMLRLPGNAPLSFESYFEIEVLP